ncbi:MAG TPA: hypothetical protein VMS76_13510, partial [Planctomycetota bacterium]|nr:hypothetical protein [Planctomycetota bacterium]
MRVARLALALAVAGCGGEAEHAPPATSAIPYEVRPVVAPAIAELERELGREDAAEVPGGAELRERVDGLLETVSESRDRLRLAALEELAGLGDVAVPLLEVKLSDVAADAALRRVAAEVL